MSRDRDRLRPRGERDQDRSHTLLLYFLCAHPSLTPSSAVALTLRAVGGLTTRQIAQAYLVPEATMAQRISRAKRTVSGVRFDQPGDVATVLRVLYLVFNEGYSGDVDLAAEAIRLTRQLAAAIDHPEVAGLLALMLLHHARRASRTAPDGSLVPLAEQDRGRWDTKLIAEGVEILQAALARDRDWCHDAALEPGEGVGQRARRVDFSYLALRAQGEPPRDPALFRIVSDALSEKWYWPPTKMMTGSKSIRFGEGPHTKTRPRASCVTQPAPQSE